MTLTAYPDKLGCYRVGDLKFYSKLEAIEAHTKTGIHPHWDFNEAVFSSYDWTQEPKDNILELYRQRAQQLRDKYDYIVLMYSGGADSHTVLESFVTNDIKLDEFVSWTTYEMTGNKNDYMNSEMFKVSYPVAQKYCEKYPLLKYRVIEISKLVVDYFTENNNTDWIYNMNMAYNANCSSRESLPLKVKEWADIIAQGKKLCVLWGKDKPRITQIDGKFAFKFIDIIDECATVKSVAGLQPYTDEFFYWTPDTPNILIKQAHLIKNYLNQINLESLPFVSLNKSDLAYRKVNGKKYWLSNHGVHSIIYPNWDINTYSSGKITSLIYSDRDTWFYNSNNHDILNNWRNGLDELVRIIPDYWKNDIKDLSKGLKACWSKDYYLE